MIDISDRMSNGEMSRKKNVEKTEKKVKIPRNFPESTKTFFF